MNILSHLKYIALCFVLMSTGSLFSAAVSPTDYYSDANLTQLNAQGIRKHAPLTIIIDQENQENPQSESLALTVNFARMLEGAFTPMLISRSIAYNYFYRRFKSTNDILKRFVPNYEFISLKEWSLYEVPHSQFLLFVPDHYVKQYQPNLGLRLNNLKNITTEFTYDYLRLLSNVQPFSVDNAFSIDNLRSVLNTIKTSSSESEPLTKSELKQQAQSPIWDIILNGHGRNGIIADLSANDVLALLNFFNQELSVGTVFIETCNAGGDNLTLLEFDRSINKEQVLRNLDYILIVGAITDAPMYIHIKNEKKFIQFYNNAAQLQGKGASLDKLLNDLNTLMPSTLSAHGTSNIPQIWLPGGLGFQTYQIDQRIQILNKVKVHKHEEEKRPIILPDSSIAALVYAKSIGVPIVVEPHRAISTPNRTPPYWINIPNLAESLTVEHVNDLISYPALTAFYNSIDDIDAVEKMDDSKIKARHLLYPQFISMIRGSAKQHFSKIIVKPPVDLDIRKFTGVLHFLRDAFFDIGERSSIKSFYIDELVGDNDISLILESIRQNNGSSNPSEFELELRSSIGKPITLKAVIVDTQRINASIDFIFNDKLWSMYFDPSKMANDKITLYLDRSQIPTFWQFEKYEKRTKDHLQYYKSDVDSMRQDIPDQKSISDVIRSKLPKEEK